MLSNIFLLILICGCIVSKEIPSFVHLCRRNDPKINECFVNTIYELMPRLVKGIPELDIPPIDPLYFNTIKVDTGNGASVSMVIEIINGSVSGLAELKVHNHVMDFNKVEFAADLEIPQVQINGIYKVRGKILLFELNGAGHCNFNASDIRTHGVWQGSTYMKKNETHINIDNIVFNNIKIANLRVKFEELFGENVVLTETVNNAINDNIPSLQGELEPLVKETLAEIIRDYFNRVYRQFPLDVLYPND